MEYLAVNAGANYEAGRTPAVLRHISRLALRMVSDIIPLQITVDLYTHQPYSVSLLAISDHMKKRQEYGPNQTRSITIHGRYYLTLLLAEQVLHYQESIPPRHY